VRSHKTIDEVYSPMFADQLWLTDINEVYDESAVKKLQECLLWRALELSMFTFLLQ
jgi:hypothetical protein